MSSVFFSTFIPCRFIEMHCLLEDSSCGGDGTLGGKSHEAC